MNVLVCVKRVPLTGGRIVLTEDERAISTRHLGFTISPHEECAVEEAVRLVEAHGGASTVLTLGPAEAEEQLRDMMAIGADRAVHLVTDGAGVGPPGHGGGDRLGHPGRSPSPSTCSCSATSPPTPATTRSPCASPTRSDCPA